MRQPITLCPHGKRTDRGVECGGVGIYQHGRRRGHCKECGGASLCKPHGRRKNNCTLCRGTSARRICQHGCQRCHCKKCKKTEPLSRNGGGLKSPSTWYTGCGDSIVICEHKRLQSVCVLCKGSGLCAHGVMRSRCQKKDCVQHRHEGQLQAASLLRTPLLQRAAAHELQREAQSTAYKAIQANNMPCRCNLCFEDIPETRSGRPTPPDDGWGCTPCCGTSYHIECLGDWLKHDRGGAGGTAPQCPTCCWEPSVSVGAAAVPKIEADDIDECIDGIAFGSMWPLGLTHGGGCFSLSMDNAPKKHRS